MFLTSTFFIKCTSSVPVENEVEQKSIYLANNIDTNSLNLLRRFSYGSRGDDNFWLRVSADTTLYLCNYEIEGDTAKLSVWRPYKFMRDFSSTFNFDTSVYSQFTFAKLGDKITEIKLDSSKGKTLRKDTLVLVNQLFPEDNPFTTFSELTSIAKKYRFIGSSYSSDIGEFFIFRVAPRFKLLYIPDTLKMNPEFKREWLDMFNGGKKIKKDWSLVDLDKKQVALP